MGGHSQNGVPQQLGCCLFSKRLAPDDALLPLRKRTVAPDPPGRKEPEEHFSASPRLGPGASRAPSPSSKCRALAPSTQWKPNETTLACGRGEHRTKTKQAPSPGVQQKSPHTTHPFPLEADYPWAPKQSQIRPKPKGLTYYPQIYKLLPKHAQEPATQNTQHSLRR